MIDTKEKVYELMCGYWNLEDIDVACIIGNLLEITHLLSLQMFDYGTRFAEQANRNKIEAECTG